MDTNANFLIYSKCFCIHNRIEISLYHNLLNTGDDPMIDEKSKTSRFVGLFLLGNFLFCFPVLTLFNTKAVFLGIPIFFFFMFSAWLVLIGLMIICAESNPKIPLDESESTEDRTDS